MSVGLTRAQHAFAAALLNVEAGAPTDLRNAASRRASSGFAVYRNNVASSLINVLAARFPVVVRLIGEEAFRGLALRFIALHPPRSPVLIRYGDDFPRFMCSLSETSLAEYLADIARIEVARGHAYHAADAEPLAAERFARLTPDELPRLQVLLHPSLTLLRSRFPVVSAWEASQPGSDATIRCWTAEDAMVFRPHHEVQVVRLAEGGFAFLSALSTGAPLASAIAAAMQDDPAFDLAGSLALLAGSGMVVDLR
jgi:hypothetical protein